MSPASHREDSRRTGPSINETGRDAADTTVGCIKGCIPLLPFREGKVPPSLRVASRMRRRLPRLKKKVERKKKDKKKGNRRGSKGGQKS